MDTSEANFEKLVHANILWLKWASSSFKVGPYYNLGYRHNDNYGLNFVFVAYNQFDDRISFKVPVNDPSMYGLRV